MQEKVDFVTLGYEKSRGEPCDAFKLPERLNRLRGWPGDATDGRKRQRAPAFMKVRRQDARVAPEIDGEADLSVIRADIGEIRKARSTRTYEYDLTGEGIA